MASNFTASRRTRFQRKLLTTVVDSLPSAATAGLGALAAASDVTSAARGATATGGGAIMGLVVSDGTNWKIT